MLGCIICSFLGYFNRGNIRSRAKCLLMTFRKCYEIFIFYFYCRRQGNACEIQFRGLLYAREVLISRTVAQKKNFAFSDEKKFSS
jgi:hypothetical protein